MRSQFALRFGRSLKAHRKAVGLGQVELAGKLGTTQSTVSRWERGFALPDAEAIDRLTGVLGTPVEELFAS